MKLAWDVALPAEGNTLKTKKCSFTSNIYNTAVHNKKAKPRHTYSLDSKHVDVESLVLG
jgi:hypothetical protein